MRLSTVRRGMLLAAMLAVFAAIFGYVAASQVVAQRGDPQPPPPVQIQYLCVDQGTNIVRFDEDGVCPGGRAVLTIPDDYPLSFCFNQHDGVLRLMTGASCPASFTLVEVPADGQLELCINQYTQVLRVANGQACRSHERAALISGPPPVADPVSVTTDEDVPVDITLTGSSSLPSPEGDLTFQIVDQPDHGSLSALFNETATSADVTYTPDPDYNGTDSFTFTVSDAFATSTEATVDITINPVNDAPVAQDDLFTTDEDSQVVADLLSNNGNGPDSDVDNDPLTVVQINGAAFTPGSPITLPSGATLTVNSDGTFTYDPTTSPALNALAAGESTEDGFTYTIQDPGGLTDDATVTITVNGVNDPPAATDNAYTIDQNTSATGNVLTDDTGAGVDSDPDASDTLVVSAVDGSAANVGTQIALESGALLTVNSDGSFDYDPNGAFDYLNDGETADDSFTYEISDGNGGTDSAVVTITVTGLNDDPVATDNEYTTTEDDAVSGNVITDDTGDGADSDPDSNDILTVTEVNGSMANVGSQITLTSGALLTVNADGSFSYDPNGAFDGLGVGEAASDSFTYQLSDGTAVATATVTIQITGVNDVPTATDNSYAITQDETASGNVITDDTGAGADSDPDTNDTLTVSEVNGDAGDVGNQITLVSGALLTVNADGSFSYDPNGVFDDLGAGETEDDTFTYTISDGNGGTDSATVTITVTGVNDPPVATDNAYATDQNTTATGNVITDDTGSGADSDPDTSDTLTVTEVDGAAFTSGSPITLPSGALLTINSDGSFSYDPNGAFDDLGAGETEDDTFTYTISDGSGATDSATVTITITGLNDPPIASNDDYAADANMELTGNVITDDTGAGTDSDPDGDPLVVSMVNNSAGNVDEEITLVSGATLTVNSDGSFTYDPTSSTIFQELDSGESMEDSFSYEISDGNGGTDLGGVTITVNGIADPPVAQDDAFATDEDTVLNGSINVLDDNGNGPDFDVEGGTLTVIELNGVAAGIATPTVLPSGATVTLGSSGALTYDPTTSPTLQDLGEGETFDDTFTYTIEDPTGLTDSATVTVTVTGTNDPPVAQDDAFSTDEDTALSGDVLADNGSGPDSDSDNNPLTVVQVDGATFTAGSPITLSSGALLTMNSDGTFSYDPNGQFEDLNVGESATDSFTYTIDDGSGATDSATVTITINGLNDAPTAIDDSYTTDEDTPVDGNVITDDTGNGADSDPDDTALSVVEVNGTTFSSGSPITLASGATLTINSDGSFSYDPSTSATFQALADGESESDSFTYAISDGTATSNAATVTITVNGVNDAPLAVADTYDAVGNTLLVVEVTGPFSEPVLVSSLEDLLANDTDPEGDTLSVVPESFTAPDGGVVQTFADGSFRYTPPPGERTSGTFDYTLTDGTDQVTGTVTVNIGTMVWYADNTNAGGTGTSTNPFQQLSEAESASQAGDTIFVYQGDGTAANQNSGITLKDNQRLIGEGVDLVVNIGGNDATLFTGDAANRPVIGNSAGDVVTLEDNNEIAGVQLTPTASAGVIGNGDTGGVLRDSLINIGGGSGTNDGVSLTNHATSFTITNTTIEGASSGDALFISGGSAAVTVSGSAFNTSGGRLFDITQYGGAFDFTGSTVGTDDHAGLSITDSGSGASYAGLPDIITTTAYDSPLVNLTNNPSQSFSFGRIAVTNTDGPGVVVSNATALSISDGTSLISTTNGQGLSLGNVATLGVNLASVTVANSPAIGVNLASNGGTTNLGALNVTTTGAAGLVATSAGTVNATSGTISATNAPAVDVSGTALGISLSSVSSSNNTTAGIRLVNATGSFVATGGTLGSISGTALDINGGSGTVTYGGSITNTANHSVAIQSRSGGAVTVSGAVTDTGTGVLVTGNTAGTSTFSGTLDLDTGANAAISLVNNTGHTVSFTGTFDIDTTGGAGLTATGGGTLTGDVTGSIVTQTGIAINVVNTSFGAGGFVIDAVSAGTGASGPASGIVLNTTGSTGGLSVTGDGSTSLGGNDSGGVIQNTSGAGVSLNNTAGVSLRNMTISDTGGHGIEGTAVNGFSLLSSTLSGAGDGDNEHGVQFVNSTSTLAVDNVSFALAAENLFAVYNINSNATVNVTNSAFTETTGAFGADGVTLQVQGSSVVTLNVNNNTFGTLAAGLDGQAVSVGNAVPGGSTPATGTVNFNADGNVSNHDPADTDNKSGAFHISGQDSLTINLDLTNNSFNGAKGPGVIAVDANDSSVVRGWIGRAGEGNTIFNATGSEGIALLADETASVVVVVQDNVITNSGSDGIQIGNFGSSTGTASSMDVSLINNTIMGHNQSDNAFFAGINILGGGAAGGHTCINMNSNTVTGSPVGFFDYYLDDFGASSAMLIQGPTSNAVTVADIQALNNQPAAIVDLFGAINFSNGAPCQTP